ncbi:hypothetical protein ACHAWX_003497 [Stephanocyclus meneghinianus]
MTDFESTSISPRFDIASLPSVHEHDWRVSSLVDGDTKTAVTLNLDGGAVEDPYSDLYRARESECQIVAPQVLPPPPPPQPKPQPSRQAIAKRMYGQQQRVSFGANTESEEVVHINAMFHPTSSSNNHTGSAQAGSSPNYYAQHPQPIQQMHQGYVPNKFSAHYDPNMPDWEGVTIAERTMADISTVTPPPDDYYNPYAAPPVAMVAAATPGTPWEELEETDAERAHWRNPQYASAAVTVGGGSAGQGGASIISGEQSALAPKDRKLLWGLMMLVGLLVVAVAVVVPFSLKAVRDASAAKSQSSEMVAVEGNPGVGGSTSSPSLMPSIWSETLTTESGKPCDEPPCDNTEGLPTTTEPPTDDTSVIPPTTEIPTTTEPATTKPAITEPATSEPAITEPTTSEPAVTEPATREPSQSPKTPEPTEPTQTSQPNPTPAETTPAATPEPTPEPTPQPTPKPTRKPTLAPTDSSDTYPPTSSSTDSTPSGSQNLDSRAIAWLEAHNTRRKTFHEQYGETYIPLVWSEALAADAQSWADEMNDGSACSATTQNNDDYGQSTSAWWSTSIDTLDSPDDVLADWVDDEEGMDYPDNRKLTQAMWRATKYLGCGESLQEFPTRGTTAMCRMYVCFYIRKGNCNMDNYNDWTVPVLLDDSQCGVECPSEGCFWDASSTRRSMAL